MSSSLVRAVVVLLVLAALSIETPAASRSSIYTIIDLGTLPGGEGSQANDLNSRGQVVGASLVGGYFHAFFWEAGVMTELPPLPGHPGAVANGINDRNQIAGSSGGVNDIWRAVLWDRGVPIDLGRLPGAVSCTAQAVNNRGQVVGACELESGGPGGFLWENGLMISLGALPDSGFTFPTGINHHGRVAGVAIDALFELHAFGWDAGSIAKLGTLPGGPASYAGGINNRGAIAGWSQDALGTFFAVLWKQGHVVNLGTSPGKTWSQAFAINDRGDVAGRVERTPALWHLGAVSELPTLQGGTGLALAVNNRGEMAGVAETFNGLPRAVVWHDGRLIERSRSIVWDFGPETGLVTPPEGGGVALLNSSDGQNFVDSVSLGRDTPVSGLHIYTSSAHLPFLGTHFRVKVLRDSNGVPGAPLAELDVVPTSVTYAGAFDTIAAHTTDVHRVTLRFPAIRFEKGVRYWVGASGVGFDAGLYGVVGPDDGSMFFLNGSTVVGPAPPTFGDQMFQLVTTTQPRHR